MGVAGFEAFVLEHFKARLQRQQISNDVSCAMPAFDERGMGAGVHQRVGGAFHIVGRVYVAAR